MLGLPRHWPERGRCRRPRRLSPVRRDWRLLALQRHPAPRPSRAEKNGGSTVATATVCWSCRKALVRSRSLASRVVLDHYAEALHVCQGVRETASVALPSFDGRYRRIARAGRRYRVPWNGTYTLPIFRQPPARLRATTA